MTDISIKTVVNVLYMWYEKNVFGCTRGQSKLSQPGVIVNYESSYSY